MTNRGKDFEKIIKEAFEKVKGVSIDRLHDQMNGYACSYNICDFIVYKEPYEYYIECKSVHGNLLPFSNITPNQWRGMLEKSKIQGVRAGVICWWCDKDITMYIPIQVLQHYKDMGAKSIRFDDPFSELLHIKGKKKRVFYEYDMEDFFNEV